MNDTRPPQFLRRDFLFGSAAGLAVTKSVGFAYPDRFPVGANPSFAECGEDVIARRLLEELGVKQPTYLDIGACDPVRMNNTFLLYRSGGRGVLVEPNVDLISQLKRERPGDTVLNVGVGLEGRSTGEYYRMSLLCWNTFDREEAERAVKETGGGVKIEAVVKMPLVPINAILAEHFAARSPDFLSIDVEGLDLPILKTLDFQRFRPKVLCVETLVKLTSRMMPEPTEFLASKGYVPRAVTFPNTIYVDKVLLDHVS